jgi:acetyl esterase/lipase
MALDALRRAMLAALGLGLAGCSPTRLADMLAPKTGYLAHPGLAYGEDVRQKLDLYLPQSGTGPYPIVVFFYGGSWQGGSRESYRFVAQALCSVGVAVAIPDYRIYPAVRYPAFIEDSAAAVAWIQAQAGTWRLDPTRMLLCGHSAGAYNAAMVAMDPAWLEAAGGRHDWIGAFMGLAGPYQLPARQRGALLDIFSSGASWEETWVTRHLRKPPPRTLLMHGRDDVTVYPVQSELLAAALREQGAVVELQLVGGVGHVTLAAAYLPQMRRFAPVVENTRALVAELPANRSS